MIELSISARTVSGSIDCSRSSYAMATWLACEGAMVMCVRGRGEKAEEEGL